MNQNPAEELTSVAETARRKALQAAEAAQDGALDAVAAAESYIRKNPWLTVGGALVAGIVVAALIPRRPVQTGRVQAVQDWLEDAYAKVSEQLPDKEDVRSITESVPSSLCALGKKLHLW